MGFFKKSSIMTNERFCLKWNDFQNLAQVSFGELRNDNDFTDVTLACEDQSIKAHKVVLSACSPFFKKLLKIHSHPQPLIYMKGMKSSSLTAIMDFLYLGEANVFQEELDCFLALAEEFQLKGLGNSEENQEQPNERFNHNERGAEVNQRHNNPLRVISDVKFENEANLFKGGAIKPYQQKPKLHGLIEPATMAKIESMIDKRVDGYYCKNCGYKTKRTRKDHMKEHVEKHIDGLEYPCDSCNKIMRSSHSLREHKRHCSPLK